MGKAKWYARVWEYITGLLVGATRFAFCAAVYLQNGRHFATAVYLQSMDIPTEDHFREAKEMAERRNGGDNG